MSAAGPLRKETEEASPIQQSETVGESGRPIGKHGRAALLIAQGAHPKAIQAHLGHSSIQVTMDRYGHLFPDALEHLADRLDAARAAAQTDPAARWRGEAARASGAG
jgi:hypothetical protein